MIISIIIPTYNRAKSLDATLQSIHTVLSVSRFKNVEVLIIDNGSTDDTKEISMKWVTKINTCKYIYETVPGLLSGRHRGAAEAKGEILCFVDDDVVLSPTWIDAIAETMYAKPDIQLMTGPILPKFETAAPEWINYFWSPAPYGGKACIWLSLLHFDKKEQLVNANYIWGLNFTIRKITFHSLGGFHPDNIPKSLQHFQGDGETGLTIKANEKNCKAWYHPDAMLYHQVATSRLTYEYFDQRAFYQGVGNSYTAIRKLNGHYKNDFDTLKRKTINNLKSTLMPAKEFIYQKISGDKVPYSMQQLKKRFDAKEIEGYKFHQASFNESEIVRKWVLKENYFDYKLPLENDREYKV